ncbi:MAG: nicotinate-nucleotide adenylyltransferase [Aeromonadaceae bacterium]
MKPAIGILGGTFDPIHMGHLQPAQHALQQLQLAELRLLPNHIPPHRPQPVASSEQRLAMARLAASELPHFRVDDRELRRSRPSYTIDTLIELRKELPDTPLCFLIGMDSLLGLNSWHRWQELTDYAHLVVSVRPGWQPEFAPEIAHFLQQHLCHEPLAVHKQLAGRLLLLDNPPIAISATALRQALQAGSPTAAWIPQKVAEYIRHEQIYGGSVL